MKKPPKFIFAKLRNKNVKPRIIKGRGVVIIIGKYQRPHMAPFKPIYVRPNDD